MFSRPCMCKKRPTPSLSSVQPNVQIRVWMDFVGKRGRMERREGGDGRNDGRCERLQSCREGGGQENRVGMKRLESFCVESCSGVGVEASQKEEERSRVEGR